LALRRDIEKLALSSERIASASPAAACALECAVLDWLARREGISLAALLADGRELREEVEVNVVATPVDLAAGTLVEKAVQAWDAGYRAFKLKVARPGSEVAELRAAEALRDSLPEMTLRLDANCGWDVSEVPTKLSDFSPFCPAFCEQPSPVGTLASLRNLPTPFAADESVRSAGELNTLLKPSAHSELAALVLKPMALGGALRCLAIGQAAAHAGVPLVVTHLMDGPLSAALSAELASALPGRVLASGLAMHPNLQAWAVSIPQLRGARAGSAGLPGLGLKLETVPT
jgi:L-alanine-DL-glutamate epimerase-like enolase superfamily enzyme